MEPSGRLAKEEMFTARDQDAVIPIGFCVRSRRSGGYDSHRAHVQG